MTNLAYSRIMDLSIAAESNNFAQIIGVQAAAYRRAPGSSLISLLLGQVDQLYYH